MSVQLLRDDTLAQIANTLYGLSSLVGKGELPRPLSAALKKLIDFTPVDYSSMRLFSGLDGDRDSDQRKRDVAVMALGFSQMNRKAYQEAHPSENLSPETPIEAWQPLLEKNGSLIHLAFIESGESVEQSAMFRYFANQLTRLSENIGQSYVGSRLASVFNEIAVASAEAAFSVHPAYSQSSLERGVIADDLIQLSVNGQALVVDTDGVSDALDMLSTAYTQGPSGHLVKVDGADMFTYLLSHSNHDEVKIPTFNEHAEIPFKVQSARDVSAVKYKLASDVGKPNDFSMMRVFRALDWVDLRYRSKMPNQLVKLDGTPFSQGEKDKLIQSIRGVRSALAWQYAQKTQPFPVETVYSQDLKAFKLQTIRATPLYLVGNINLMPLAESLKDLQVRLSESVPEVVFELNKSLNPGVNNNQLTVTMSPKFGIDEVSLYEMITQDQYTRDRVTYALQDLSAYAHAHDIQICFVPGMGIDPKLMRDLMINVATVRESVEPNGKVTFESPKTNALSVPNGRDGLMLVLQSPPAEFISREIARGHFIAFDDLDKAKMVVDNLVKYDPGAAKTLNLAKIMSRAQDVGYLKPQLINDPLSYLIDEAMNSAIKGNDDVWPEYSEEGRVAVLVTECHRRNLLQETDTQAFTQCVRQRLEGKDGVQDALNQVRAIRIEFIKQKEQKVDVQQEVNQHPQVSLEMSAPGRRR